jgi:hypothetical protein
MFIIPSPQEHDKVTIYNKYEVFSPHISGTLFHTYKHEDLEDVAIMVMVMSTQARS